MSKARCNGDGTFSKLDSGNWRYRINARNPLTGEVVRKSFTGKTQQICRDKLKAFESGKDLENFAEYTSLKSAIENWLKVYAKPKVAEVTYDGYLSTVKIIYNDEVSKMDIQKIKPMHLKEFFNRHEKCSLSTLKKLHYFIVATYNMLLDNDIVAKNPCARVPVASKTEIKVRETFTGKEIENIIEFSKTNAFGFAIMLLLFTGVRSGELRWIKTTDIDFKSNMLKLRGAVDKNGDSVATSKNKNHNRDLPIPEEVSKLLKKHCTKGYILTGTDYPAGKDQLRWRYKNFFDELNTWCVENSKEEVRPLTPHCARHTYNTLLYKNGVDKLTRMELMGHKSEDVNFAYTHSDFNTKKEAVTQAFLTII